MRPLIQEIQTAHTPESLVENLRAENQRQIILLRSSPRQSETASDNFFES
jgi:hypothetical protein